MAVGQNTYQMTMGSLGGYVMTYDIRYSLVSSMFRHNLNNPILSLSQLYRPQTVTGLPQMYQRTTSNAGYALISSGCSQYELAQLNLETGKIERFYRSSEVSDRELMPADVTNLPEYIKETRFTDIHINTLRREANAGLYSRALRNFPNHTSF